MLNKTITFFQKTKQNTCSSIYVLSVQSSNVLLQRQTSWKSIISAILFGVISGTKLSHFNYTNRIIIENVCDSHLCVSLTFFCPLLELQSSSEFFTFDLVRVTSFFLGPRWSPSNNKQPSETLLMYRDSHKRCTRARTALIDISTYPKHNTHSCCPCWR